MAVCRCWERQVYNSDNEGEQLVRQSFQATSAHLNFDLGINLSDTVSRGPLGLSFFFSHPTAAHLLSAKYAEY